MEGKTARGLPRVSPVEVGAGGGGERIGGRERPKTVRPDSFPHEKRPGPGAVLYENVSNRKIYSHCSIVIIKFRKQDGSHSGLTEGTASC